MAYYRTEGLQTKLEVVVRQATLGDVVDGINEHWNLDDSEKNRMLGLALRPNAKREFFNILDGKDHAAVILTIAGVLRHLEKVNCTIAYQLRNVPVSAELCELLYKSLALSTNRQKVRSSLMPAMVVKTKKQLQFQG